MSFRTQILPRFFVVCVPILLVVVCWQPLKASSDIWSHAAVGRWIVENHAIPHKALFLWSYSGDWIAHSWLAEIGIYELMNVCGEMMGAVLMVLLTALIVLVAFGIALWPAIDDRRMQLPVAVMFLAALTAATPRFVPRPDLVTTLFTVILCAVLIKLPSTPDKKIFLRLSWIPLMFALWTNLHGAVLFGLVCLWISAVCSTLQERKAAPLIVIAVISTLALLVNPYGLSYLGIFAPLVNHDFAYIDEWRPFWQIPQTSPSIPASELVLFIGGVWAWWFSRERRLQEIGWIALATLAFLSARRNMDLMALICLIVFCKNYRVSAENFVQSASRKAASMKIGAVAAWLVGLYFVYLLFVCIGFAVLIPFVQTTRDALPTGQAQAIAHNLPAGAKVLNLYNFGSYLEWRLGEKQTIYIDGLNAYPKSIFDNFVQIWNATPQGLALLNSNPPDCIAEAPLQRGQPVPGLYKYLVSNSAWRLAYNQPEYQVYVRAGSVKSKQP